MLISSRVLLAASSRASTLLIPFHPPLVWDLGGDAGALEKRGSVFALADENLLVQALIVKCDQHVRLLTLTMHSPRDVRVTHWRAAVGTNSAGSLRARPVAVHYASVSCQPPVRLSTRGPRRGRGCRAYSADGRFLAVLRFLPDRGLWHPDKVFAGA